MCKISIPINKNFSTFYYYNNKSKKCRIISDYFFNINKPFYNINIINVIKKHKILNFLNFSKIKGRGLILYNLSNLIT